MPHETSSFQRTAPPEVSTPIPPRYGWLKRIMIAVGVTSLALVILRLRWGQVAHARLQAEIDRLVASGEPIFPEDFNPKEPLPDDQNAAKLYKEAASLRDLSVDEHNRLDELRIKGQLSASELEKLDAILAKQSKVFPLVRKARSIPAADWGTRFTSSVFGSTNFFHTEQRMLAKLLIAKAQSQRAHGDLCSATEILGDELAHAQALSRDPSLVSHSVANAQHALIVDQVEWISFQVPKDCEEQCDTFLCHLLDEARFRDALRQCMLAERMWRIDSITWLANHEASPLPMWTAKQTPWWAKVIGYPVVPAFVLDGLDLIAFSNDMLGVSQADTLPYARSLVQSPEIRKDALGFVLQPFTRLARPSHRILTFHFRLLAQRRMAATALAIRLYELDHGHRPETLDELVPDYLPSVPLDPMAEGETPIGYLPHAERPILYSVDENGIDDGGRCQIYDDGTVNRRKFDWPFFLDGPPQ